MLRKMLGPNRYRQQMMLKARLEDLLRSGRYRIGKKWRVLVPWSLGEAVGRKQAANRANAAGAGGLLLDLQQFASEPSPSGRLGCNFPSLLNIYMVKLLHFSLLASRAHFSKRGREYQEVVPNGGTQEQKHSQQP